MGSRRWTATGSCGSRSVQPVSDPASGGERRRVGRSRLLGDASAGFVGAVGSVPDGMATAVLAGANPMAGLYASIAGPIVGGALTSTQMMVVATTSAAAVTASGVIERPGGDTLPAIATLTVLSGVAMILLTVLGLPHLMRFVSASVMTGFMLGVGLTLILGQLPDATGVPAEGDSTLLRFLDTVSKVGEVDTTSVLVTVTAIAITVVLTRVGRVTLGPVLALVVPTVVLHLASKSVQTVEDIGVVRPGLPPIVLPDLGLITPSMVGAAVAIALVILVQTAGVAAGHPDPDGHRGSLAQDFHAQGAANVASALIGGIPVGASNAQTALSTMSGGRSRLAVILGGVWMLVFVFALGPILGVIPIPALAGLLILSGVQAIKLGTLELSWRTNRASSAAAVVTLVCTLTLPIPIAVLAGVLLSLILVGISSATQIRIVGLERDERGRWTRVDAPGSAAPGQITIVDVQGSVAFSSVEDLFLHLPHPSEEAHPISPVGQGTVIVRMNGHVRTNVTFLLALQAYSRELDHAGIGVIVSGLSPKAAAEVDAAALEPAITVVPESDRIGGGLDSAYAQAEHRRDGD